MTGKPAPHCVSSHPSPPSTPQPRLLAADALSFILCRTFAFCLQLTLISHAKMSDTLVLFGSQFVTKTCSSQPLQSSPPVSHSVPGGAYLLFVCSRLVCLHCWDVKSRRGATLCILYPSLQQSILHTLEN